MTSLCYHPIAISCHNIIILTNISINIIINIIMFNYNHIFHYIIIIISYVTVTCAHAIIIGWLSPHNARTAYHII